MYYKDISEEDFIKRFPKTEKFLKNYSDKLDNRKSDKNTRWYENKTPPHCQPVMPACPVSFFMCSNRKMLAPASRRG